MDLGQILVSGGAEKEVEDLFPLFGRLQAAVGDPGFELVVSNGKTRLLKLKFNFSLTFSAVFVK
jgi:hypothetical protein